MDIFGKKTVFGVIALFVFILAAWKIWYVQSNTMNAGLNTDKNEAVTVPQGHIWSEYKNEELGFVIDYPADIVQAREITEPASNGIPEAKEVSFFNEAMHPLESPLSQEYISVWTQETEAKTADDWFESVYAPDGRGWYISSRDTIDGVPAISVSEKVPSIAAESYDRTFVREGKVWIITLNDGRFSQKELDYILQSFRFIP